MPKTRSVLRSLSRKKVMTLGTIAAAAIAGGCDVGDHRAGAAELKDHNMALAAGPTAMWYRFRFAAFYRGRPFAFDPYVHCGLRTIPGGPFDSAPDIANRAMYPRTVGQRMWDGSYVAVRVPDMCQQHRAVDGNQAKQIGWQSRGPFEVLPLVIWNDRRPQTTVVERYVARGYYGQPGARITNPRGSVELMPVGFHPDDYAALLARPEFATTDPEENTDPATGKRFRNVYASNSNGLAAFFTVPTADMAVALARYNELPSAIVQRLGVSRMEQLNVDTDSVRLYLTKTREALGLREGEPVALKPAPGPASAVALYEDSLHYNERPFSYDATYLPPAAIWQCIGDLAAGVPVLSNLPVGRNVAAGLRHPMWIARAVAREKVARARSAAACAALDGLVSYDVRNGRLDATGAVPGAIVRRQWHVTNMPEQPSLLEREGVAFRTGKDRLPQNYRFRIGGVDADLQLRYPSYIVHDRKSDQWLALFYDTNRLVTDRSVEGGW